jgi:hypothetical protein
VEVGIPNPYCMRSKQLPPDYQDLAKAENWWQIDQEQPNNKRPQMIPDSRPRGPTLQSLRCERVADQNTTLTLRSIVQPKNADSSSMKRLTTNFKIDSLEK